MSSCLVSVQPLPVKVRRLHPERDRDLPLPQRMSAAAAGLDVVAAIDAAQTLAAGQWAAIATGLAFEVPPGYEIQVRPRSGLALHHGVTLLNAPGTIDADYRGELRIILVNLGSAPYTIRRGDRIAQLVLAPVISCTLSEVGQLSDSARDSGGFGHTGR